MMIRSVGLLCVALAIGTPPDARKLVPVDESRGNPVLKVFRDRVVDAARREDLSRLRPLIGNPARFDSEELTPDAFIARMRAMAAADRAELWKQLRNALALGMAYSGSGVESSLIAPYTFVLLKNPESIAITGAKVALHERADAASPIVARLDYDVVGYGPDGMTDEWVNIEMADGRVGWVAARYAHSPGEPRFQFGKIGGVWKLIGYGTGD
jgi:hypothetical protein